MKATQSANPTVTPFAIFLTFTQITLSAFGGAIFWTRRALVEQRKWLDDKQFIELLTLSQLLPGPNILNLTVLVGYRFCGWTGAAAGVAGFLGWPSLMVIGMGYLYSRYGALPDVQRALATMSSVAAGLLLATVIKLSMVLPKRPRPWIFLALVFVAIAIFRVPMLWVIAALAPCAVFAAWKEMT